MNNKQDIINKLAKKFVDYNKNKLDEKKPSNENKQVKQKPVNNTIKKIEYKWDKDNQLIYINFGKNGLGLTTDFIEIGKFIERLSQTSFVYIHSTFIDELDDVYTIVLHYIYK